MKKVIELEPKPTRPPVSKFLFILSAVLLAAFVLLLLVGFENVLALLRYRVALFLVLAPPVALFLWCGYKAFGPRNRP